MTCIKRNEVIWNVRFQATVIKSRLKKTEVEWNQGEKNIPEF